MAQLLLNNFQLVQLSELWGLIDKEEELTGCLLLSKDKIALPGGCWVSFVSIVTHTALSWRLEPLVSVSFYCLTLPELHGLQTIGWVSVVDSRRPEIIWYSSPWKVEFMPLPFESARLLWLLWLIEFNENITVPVLSYSLNRLEESMFLKYSLWESWGMIEEIWLFWN